VVPGLAGRSAAPLRLRSPFRHREVEGSSGSRPCVYSSSYLEFGSGRRLETEARLSMCQNNFSPSVPRPGVVLRGCVGEVVEMVLCPCLTGEAVAAVELGLFVLGPLPCSAGASSGAGGEDSGDLYRSWWLAAVASSLWPASPDFWRSSRSWGCGGALRFTGCSGQVRWRLVDGSAQRSGRGCLDDGFVVRRVWALSRLMQLNCFFVLPFVASFYCSSLSSVRGCGVELWQVGRSSFLFAGGVSATTAGDEGRRWWSVQASQGLIFFFSLVGVVCAFVLYTCVCPECSGGCEVCFVLGFSI